MLATLDGHDDPSAHVPGLDFAMGIGGSGEGQRLMNVDAELSALLQTCQLGQDSSRPVAAQDLYADVAVWEGDLPTDDAQALAS